MTSVRKKTSSEIFRTPSWLRGPPRSLRSIMNPEEVSIYRRMRKSIIQELRPETPVEWILVNEFVNAHFSATRYATWQAAVMQFSVGEGLRRAVKNQLRRGNKGSKADLDWRGSSKCVKSGSISGGTSCGVSASTFRRRRSAGLRVMEIPARMRQTRMRPVRWESPPGFKCQTLSTLMIADKGL